MKGERSGSAFPAWAPLALLIGLTAFAYLPSLANGFIWDDDVSLTQNPFIRSGEGLHDFWVTTLTPDYWPVTATTLWAEWRLWGMNPLGYHVTNLVLHVAEVLLLWTILRRLQVPGATLAALLFALHPVNVESVAWITQRKNLMGMLFYLASIHWFLKTDWALPTPIRRSPAGRDEGGPSNWRWYILSLLAFALGMLAKGSVAVLPAVLLGVIAWRRPLRAGDFLRLAPFFAVAGALTLVDIWFQGHHLAAAEIIRHAGALERLLGAGAVAWFYLSKALLPIRLILPYPQWRIDPASLGWWVPLLSALALTGWLWRRRREQPLERGALFAWGYFCVALIPVMGFTDVNFMKFSLVADHYQHLALIGVTTLAGAGWAEWRRRGPVTLPWAAAVVAVGLLGALTWRQCLRYRDMGTFFEATLRQNPDSAMAHLNLGMVLDAEQRPLEAMAHFMEAARLDPGSAEAHSNLGAALIGQGRVGEGMAQYAAALRLKPGLFVVHLNLGSVLLHEGRLEEARSELAAAVRLKPSFPEAHGLLGDALLRLGHPAEAAGEYEAVLRLRPDDPSARGRLERARALEAGARP